ncbi:hypothetical protein LTR65_004020 [Meristemomyces frigidus]
MPVPTQAEAADAREKDLTLLKKLTAGSGQKRKKTPAKKTKKVAKDDEEAFELRANPSAELDKVMALGPAAQFEVPIVAGGPNKGNIRRQGEGGLYEIRKKQEWMWCEWCQAAKMKGGFTRRYKWWYHFMDEPKLFTDADWDE